MNLPIWPEELADSHDYRIRFGSKLFFWVFAGYAAFLAMVVLSGETGDAWPIVVSIAVGQFLLSLPLGLVMSQPRLYPYANAGLAAINFSAGAAIMIVCGGYPTHMWMTQLFGVFPAAFFLGRAGVFLNAGVALAGLVIPHMSALDATILVGAGAHAITLLALGLVAAPLFEVVAVAEAHQRRAAEALQSANEELTSALSVARLESDKKILINEMSDMIQSCSETGEALSILAGFGRRLFPTHAGALFLYRNSRDTLELAVQWGRFEVESPRAFRSAECWALRRGRPHRSDGVSPEVRCQHIEDEGPSGDALCVPMLAQGEILGVFHLQANARPPDAAEGSEPAAPIDETLAVTVARDGALGLANMRLRETLRNQALRDGLTQLYNRRYLEEALPREVHRAERRGAPLTVAMLDIDHFKAFNDTHGHAAGDLVLREVGAFLAARTRKEDLACRYGGEEFVIVFADTPMKVAIARAEELRQGLAALRVQQDQRPLGRLTISVGIAAMPEVRPEDLMRVADSMLYRAKAEGRDRVVAYMQP